MITADHVALAVYTAGKALGLSNEEKLSVLQGAASVNASRVRMYAARVLRRIEPTISANALVRLLAHPAHGKVQRDKHGAPDSGATSFMSMIYIAHQKPWWSGATFEAVLSAVDGRSVYPYNTEGLTPPETPACAEPVEAVSAAPARCPVDGEPCIRSPGADAPSESCCCFASNESTKRDAAPEAPAVGAGAPSADPMPTQPPAVEPAPAAAPGRKRRPSPIYPLLPLPKAVLEEEPRLVPKLLKAQKRNPEKVLPSGITTKGTASYGGINEPASHKTGLAKMLEEALINTAKQQAAERDDD